MREYSHMARLIAPASRRNRARQSIPYSAFALSLVIVRF